MLLLNSGVTIYIISLMVVLGAVCVAGTIVQSRKQYPSKSRSGQS